MYLTRAVGNRVLVGCAVLSLLGVSAIVRAAAPESTTMEAEGEAPVIGKDEQRAFEEARNQALRAAVERAAGALVEGDTQTLNSLLVRDRVFVNASGYVRRYDIVSRKIVRGVAQVTLRVDVGTGPLNRDLMAAAALVKRLGRTRLLVALQEQAMDDKGIAVRSEVVSTELARVFRTDGWTLIDEKGTGAEERLRLASGVAAGSLEAKEILRKSDADYIVYGSVNLRYIPPARGTSLVPEVNERGEQLVFFVTGEYELSMFETRTGAQVARVAGRIDQKSLQKVQFGKSYAQTAHDLARIEAPRIATELRNPVLEFLRSQDVNGRPIAVTAMGVADFKRATELGQALGGIRGVKSVKTLDFSGGAANYELLFLGTSEDLGLAVGDATFKKSKLTVTGVRHNRVEVQVGR